MTPGKGGRRRKVEVAEAAATRSTGKGGLEGARLAKSLEVPSFQVGNWAQAPKHLKALDDSILGHLFWGLSVGRPSCFHIITS